MGSSLYATAGEIAQPFLVELAKDRRNGLCLGREFFLAADAILDEALNTAYEIAANAIKAELVPH